MASVEPPAELFNEQAVGKIHYETYLIAEQNCNEKKLVDFMREVLRRGQEKQKKLSIHVDLSNEEDEDLVFYVMQEVEKKIIVEGEEKSYMEMHCVATLTLTKAPPWRITFWIVKGLGEEIERDLRETVQLVFEVAKQVFDISPTPELTSLNLVKETQQSQV